MTKYKKMNLIDSDHENQQSDALKYMGYQQLNNACLMT